MAGCGWSEIPEDLLVLVAKRLHSLTDYLCAAQACKAWRSITHLPIPKPPFLLLSESNPKKEPMEPETELQEDEESEWESEEEDEEEEEEDEEEEEEEEEEDAEIPDRGIVGLSNRKGDKIWELHLPELHHNRCIGSTGNWLVTVNKELHIKIFNPFTRTQFHLPSQSTLPQHLPNQQLFGNSITKVRDRFLSKIVLSSTPKFNNPEPQGVVAAAIYGCTHNLAIAKLGDQSWTPLNSESRGTSAVEDVIFFRNRLYFVNRRGMLSSCADFSTHDPILPTEVSHFTKLRADKYYLVEWSGELVFVLRFSSLRRRFPFYKTKRFQAFKFNFDREEWDEVNCLGQHSLFLGFNTSICLLASPGSTFRKNCIYFTDDDQLGYCGNGIEGGRDMGVFDLEDGTIKPHYDGISTSLYSPPVWVIPTFIS